MCHHTMCATIVERMGMEMADTGNNDDERTAAFRAEPALFSRVTATLCVISLAVSY